MQVGGGSTKPPDDVFAAIVDSAEDAIVSKNTHGIITSWNRGAERLFGYTAAEIIGQSVRWLIPEELQHEEDRILATIRQGNRVEPYETIRLRKDGARIPVSVSISPVLDAAGRVIGASKIARDISQRKRQEHARFLLASIVDSSDDAIVSKDLNGIVTSWNRAATRIFGFTADEMIGHSIRRVIPDELQYEEDLILEKIRNGEKVDHFETTRINKDGERIDISVTISPMWNSAGAIIGASKIARDISEKKKIDRALMQSEKLAATGRMAATVAHEINNPLEAVLNLVYLAKNSLSDSAEAAEYLTTAEKELERLSQITRQTLGYYKDSSRPVELALHTLLDELLGLYGPKLQHAGVAVERNYSEHAPIVANKGEMVQVFSNLIDNAIDAMPEGGALHLRVESVSRLGEAGVQVIIRDSGQGIPADVLDRVFEPFFTTKGQFGTGIGLWVSEQIIKKHGGHIALESTAGGDASGTSVIIFLPYRRSMEADCAAPAA